MAANVLDCSHHQGQGPVGQRRAVVDFAAARAAGCAAVIIRSAYGQMIDELAAEHNRRADAAGLPRMAYSYHLSRLDPVAQAEIAFHWSGRLVGVRHWRDLEESTDNDGAEPKWPRYSEDHWRHVNASLVRLDELTGVLTGVYSNKYWLDRWFNAEQQAAWAERPLWVANYTSRPSPLIPLGWQRHTLWQYAIGRWPGFAGAVDLNRTAPGVTVGELMGVAPPPVTVTPGLAQVDALRALINGG